MTTTSPETLIPWTIGEIIHLSHMENGSSKVYLVPARVDPNGPNICIQAEGSLNITSSNWTMATYDEISGQWKLAERIKGKRLDNEAVRNLFHRCWGYASESDRYQKADWKVLSDILIEAGYQV